MRSRKRIVTFSLFVLLICLLLVGNLKSDETKYGFIQRVTNDSFPDFSELSYKMYLGICPANDTDPLDKVLTEKYSAEELFCFLSPHHTTQPVDQIKGLLYYSQINEAYSVELTRSEGYSVYKTDNGGFYYIFWGNTSGVNSFEYDEDPVLSYSTYISGVPMLEDFASLKPKYSTAAQVMSIDPYFQLSLAGTEVCSYSYFSEKEVIKITYERIKGDLVSSDALDMFVVDKIFLVNRLQSASYFAKIRDEDLP